MSSREWLVNNNQIDFVGAGLQDVFETIMSASFYVKLFYRKPGQKQIKEGQKIPCHKKKDQIRVHQQTRSLTTCMCIYLSFGFWDAAAFPKTIKALHANMVAWQLLTKLTVLTSNHNCILIIPFKIEMLNYS